MTGGRCTCGHVADQHQAGSCQAMVYGEGGGASRVVVCPCMEYLASVPPDVVSDGVDTIDDEISDGIPTSADANSIETKPINARAKGRR